MGFLGGKAISSAHNFQASQPFVQLSKNINLVFVTQTLEGKTNQRARIIRATSNVFYWRSFADKKAGAEPFKSTPVSINYNLKTEDPSTLTIQKLYSDLYDSLETKDSMDLLELDEEESDDEQDFIFSRRGLAKLAARRATMDIVPGPPGSP